MTAELNTGFVEVQLAPTRTLQVLGGEALFGGDVEVAGNVLENADGGGKDQDFEADAPAQPQKVTSFSGFSD